ncbi:YoaK family protein [Chryseobacterium sp. MYb264]|uniref:YoaK family protein n=1 Tax=Chryseobacterium sp. MYb264 TaxID=2745153 RepID=UPI002E0F3128|nr:YoaK family protein [Chryseobacterium sp. MYb264]
MSPETKASMSPEQIELHERLAILLAFVAGYMDATGIIKWKTYVSFMSGNTTQLGTSIYSEKWGIIITSATVISCFLLGIYSGTCLALWKKIRIKTLSFFIVAGILMVYSVGSYFYEITSLLSIGIMGFSMGIMNTIVTSVGNLKVNTDFVTGTLNSLAKNAALFSMSNDKEERKVYRDNAIHLLLLWTGFVSGAIVLTIVISPFGNWILIFPASLLLISAVWIKNSKIIL